MCNIPPTTYASHPMMTTNAGAAGGGPAQKSDVAGASGGGPAQKSDVAGASGGGPMEKMPVQGGGAVEGAANLQMQSVLTALTQAINALMELVKQMQASQVAGATGGGPDAKGSGPVQKDSDVAGAQGGGPDAKGSGPVQQSPVQMTPIQGGGHKHSH